jgi:hypothetical protein
VGDPETIIDADGRLPSERRATSLTMFKVRRNAEVRDHRD